MEQQTISSNVIIKLKKLNNQQCINLSYLSKLSMINNKFSINLILILNLILLIILSSSKFTYAKHDIERYSHPEIQHYKPMLFDANRLKLLVGARDYILVLNLNDFSSSYKRDYYIPPTTEKKSKCHMKGMKPEECHNFITTLLEIPTTNYKDKQILVCGTNAYSPECEIRRLSDSFEIVSKSISINSYCPYWNTTSLLTTNGEFFYGGPLDLRGIDSSIFKQKEIIPPSKYSLSAYLDRRIVRSVQHDSNWISADANFVFSFEFDQHVYFLFRETAVEYLNVGKRVYSRIGRVCKDDPGWRESWTSFLKARINCSLPGSFPFYFDEIQSVDLINYGGTPTLYAIFNTPLNSIHGSAVCAFTMDSVLEAFHGPFKYQPSTSHLWERRDDNHDVFECQVTDTNQSKSYSTLRLNSKYQQMDDAVQPIDGRPFIFSKNEHFKFIAVDLVRTKYYHNIAVMFIATTDGKLLKYVKWPDVNESCLIDEIQLIDPNENHFLSMQFWKDTESLYFGTEKEFIRISVHQCHNYHDRDQCINSGDPYCGWSEIKMKCIRPPSNNLRDENWIQSDQPTCSPRWSKWFTCSEVGLKSSRDETCKCRKRPCINLNDKNCSDGYEYQVSNCTRNGGWSEWSSWSSCIPSCGRGIQYRNRHCNNPIPSDNGKYCVGNDREERQCDNLPYCTWTPWSEWTNCSNEYNKKRTRQCLDFNGNAVDNDFCQGPYIETMKCEIKKTIEWTDWFISDLNNNELVEQRNEIVMHKNNVLPKSEQRVVSLKYCDNCGGNIYNFNGKDFLIKECSCNDEPVWSEWSDWTVCHNDIQIRERVCQLEDRSCDGHFKEIKFCHSTYNTVYQRRTEYDYSRMNWKLFSFFIMLAVILSSGLTAIILIYCFQNNNPKHEKPDLMIMNHTISSEPNTYEEPEKYRITTTTPLNSNHNHYMVPSTLTRVATLKKQTSFRAKLDDSNY